MQRFVFFSRLGTVWTVKNKCTKFNRGSPKTTTFSADRKKSLSTMLVPYHSKTIISKQSMAPKKKDKCA